MSAAYAEDDRPPVTGICIVRAVRTVHTVRGTAPRVRLTVIVNFDVEELSGETVHECPDRAAALAVVADFLDRCEYAGSGYGRHSTR